MLDEHGGSKASQGKMYARLQKMSLYRIWLCMRWILSRWDKKNALISYVYNSGPQMRMCIYNWKLFAYFSTTTYALDTQKNTS